MILCVGGTPAMQRTLRFKSFMMGGVNRAYELQVTASGKVSNAARVAATLGDEVLAISFLGGDSGRFVARALQGDGVPCEPVWVESDAPTRTCITLIPDKGPVTEMVEEAPPVSAKDVSALENAVADHLPRAEALCLIGSLPPGVPEDLYSRLTEKANKSGIPTLVDAQHALLRKALASRPFIAKPNLEEAAAALDLSRSGNNETDARAAVAALTERGAEWALVSTGKAGSVLGKSSGEMWRVEPPEVESVNPIGSGDSMAAGLLFSLARGASVPEAAVYGTACAAANTLTPTAGVVRTEDVEALLPRVRLMRLA